MNELSFQIQLSEVCEQLELLLNNFSFDDKVTKELNSIKDTVVNIINSPDMELFNEMVGVMDEIENTDTEDLYDYSDEVDDV